MVSLRANEQSQWDSAVNFLLVCTAAATAELATYPLDFVKTRVQSDVTKTGPLKTLMRVVSTEGV